MKLLEQYFVIQKEIYDYFGYKKDWVVIPIDDSTKYYWQLNEEGVRFADSIEDLLNEKAGNYYENKIYTQRFLPKFVYPGQEYTMIVVDTRTDGNKFLQIFDNKKEIPEENL